MGTVTPEFEEILTNEQISAVCDLANRIWREHFVPIIGEAQVRYMLGAFQSFDAIASQIRQDRYRYFFARLNGARAGYLAIQVRGDNLFLSKIYVTQQHRGAGIGRAMTTFVENLAEAHGCGCIRLTVNRNNLLAIGFYERTGFVRRGARVTDIGGGFVMDDYLYEKRVCRTGGQRRRTSAFGRGKPYGTRRA